MPKTDTTCDHGQFKDGIALAEMATPSAISGHVPLYAKSDGKL